MKNLKGHLTFMEGLKDLSSMTTPKTVYSKDFYLSEIFEK